jgi:hypothetical protein
MEARGLSDLFVQQSISNIAKNFVFLKECLTYKARTYNNVKFVAELSTLNLQSFH